MDCTEQAGLAIGFEYRAGAHKFSVVLLSFLHVNVVIVPQLGDNLIN
jgi:hypothetical protein